MNQFYNDKPVHTQRQYSKMVDVLEAKGFQHLGSAMWLYRTEDRKKFISIRIDLAGYIIVNFNNKTTRTLTPAQIIAGTNYLKDKGGHPVLCLP